jgi:hypothetical protein
MAKNYIGRGLRVICGGLRIPESFRRYIFVDFEEYGII